MRLLVAFGTRPEMVKLAPVVDTLRQRGHEVRVLATGQHADPRLADDIFAELGLEPDETWALPVHEAERVGALLTGAYRELADRRPDAVLVLGDTHTVPVFALAARRFRVPMIHLEAGLRSYNDCSLEEGHRLIAAALAALHLAPTELAAERLRAEGIEPRRIVVVGNPVTDALARVGPARKATSERRGIVVTAHRATNVDDPVRLRSLVGCIMRLGREVGTVTFPVHPRTAARLRETGFDRLLVDHPAVAIGSPLSYGQMLDAVSSAQVVVTDSGGLQEEAAWYGVPVVVLRSSTPRPEGVIAGTTILVGLDPGRAVEAARSFASDAAQHWVAAQPCPYGDGHVSERIAALLHEPATAALLERHEPALTPGGPETTRWPDVAPLAVGS